MGCEQWRLFTRNCNRLCTEHRSGGKKHWCRDRDFRCRGKINRIEFTFKAVRRLALVCAILIRKDPGTRTLRHSKLFRISACSQRWS